MKDIAIYGAGGFGREVACVIKKINEASEQPVWNLIGFFDDTYPKVTENEYGKVFGGMDVLNNWPTDISIVISIGTPSALKKISSLIQNKHVDFPNIISPDVTFMDRHNYKIGIGNIICPGALISCHASIGDFNILNDFVSIGHDTVVGNYNSFMTASRISGHVTIGDLNYFGVNCCVLQGLSIGNNTKIAAGSALLRRTKDGYTYMGVPASPLIIGKK